jgi:hypothetical protein
LRYTQGHEDSILYHPFPFEHPARKCQPITPHSVVTAAFGSSGLELSFLHPEQQSPTAIRQINSNLTSFILVPPDKN